jgi:hypothetical protein
MIANADHAGARTAADNTKAQLVDRGAIYQTIDLDLDGVDRCAN